MDAERSTKSCDNMVYNHDDELFFSNLFNDVIDALPEDRITVDGREYSSNYIHDGNFRSLLESVEKLANDRDSEYVRLSCKGPIENFSSVVLEFMENMMVTTQFAKPVNRFKSFLSHIFALVKLYYDFDKQLLVDDICYLYRKYCGFPQSAKFNWNMGWKVFYITEVASMRFFALMCSDAKNLLARKSLWKQNILSSPNCGFMAMNDKMSILELEEIKELYPLNLDKSMEEQILIIYDYSGTYKDFVRQNGKPSAIISQKYGPGQYDIATGNLDASEYSDSDGYSSAGNGSYTEHSEEDEHDSCVEELEELEIY